MTTAARWAALALGVLTLGSCDTARKLVGAFSAPSAQPDVLSQGEAAIVPNGPQTHQRGETALARDYSLSVIAFGPCTDAPDFAPPAGILRVGVKVRIEGTSAAQVPVNPFYGQLEDPDGRRFEAVLSGCSPGLRAQRLVKEQRAEGWISFDIPDGTERAVTFRYLPVVLGVGVEEVRFTLP